LKCVSKGLVAENWLEVALFGKNFSGAAVAAAAAAASVLFLLMLLF
jgi:hypothetical protein